MPDNKDKENILKLEKIYEGFKKRTYNQKQTLELLDFITKFINKNILQNNDFISKILKYDLKNNRDLNFNIKSSNQNIKLVDLHKTLFLLKTINAELIEKHFNFYIYSEIKSMVKFYLIQSKQEFIFDDITKLHTIDSNQYHLQNQMFKYLFSIFDKFLYINLFLNQKYELQYFDNQKTYRFLNDFNWISTPFLKDSSTNLTSIEKQLFIFDKSAAFHYIRILRNSIEHNFIDPSKTYNLSLALELLFVLISQTMFMIILNFKEDNQIFELIKSLK